MSWPAMRSAKKKAAVLAGDEACGHGEEQIDGSAQQCDSEQRGRELVPQNRLQRVFVHSGHAVEARSSARYRRPCRAL